MSGKPQKKSNIMANIKKYSWATKLSFWTQNDSLFEGLNFILSEKATLSKKTVIQRPKNCHSKQQCLPSSWATAKDLILAAQHIRFFISLRFIQNDTVLPLRFNQYDKTRNFKRPPIHLTYEIKRSCPKS